MSRPLDRRRALAASTAWLVGPLLPVRALARALIDEGDPAIHAAAQAVVAGCTTTRERAVALHDHVRDAVRFGFTARFHAMRACEVLAAGVGYGSTKATLFAALLRAAGIEARLRFVELDAAVWRGLIDLGTPKVDHCLTEVLIDGAWVPTDSYAVDTRLFRAARTALRAEGRRRGYGIDAEGALEWDGRSPAYTQWVRDPGTASGRSFGVFQDAAAFYDAVPDAWNRESEVQRLILPLAALTANQTADALRAHGASAVRGGRLRARRV
jgi:transglutaminase-like putative cysteine protease